MELGKGVAETVAPAMELQTFSARTIDVPSLFIAGSSDWGAYQRPGALENMQKSGCTRLWASTLSMAPDTGCSRNSREKS